MTKTKYFFYGVLVLGGLLWSDYRGTGSMSRTVAGTEAPLPESVRDNPGAYRAQLAAAARSTVGK